MTGHSLGGAVATLCAVDIKTELPSQGRQLFLYTFGSPRLGNDLWSDYVFGLLPDGTYQRVTHWDDIIPHAPPIPAGFKHVGDEVWYQEGDVL